MLNDDFLQVISDNSSKTAFYYAEKGKIKTITYHEVLNQTLAIKEYLLKRQIKIDKPILLLMRPSKLFYLTIFACMFLDLKIVIIDNFRNFSLVKAKIALADVQTVLVNQQTKIFAGILLAKRQIQKINLTKVDSQYEELELNEAVQRLCEKGFESKAGLITFTSGTTGIPKAVFRSLDKLAAQVTFLEKLAISHIPAKIVLPLLPVYPIFTFLKGITTFIYFERDRKKKLTKYLQDYEIDTMIASISEYLNFNIPVLSLKYAFMGGSMVRLNDAIKIQKTFPNAHFSYIYGATEAVVMAQTTLTEYLENLKMNRLCLGRVVSNVDLTVEDDELVVNHPVITNTYLNALSYQQHYTGDLGYFVNDVVYLLGKKTYSSYERPFNYELELILTNRFQKLKNVACLSLDHKNYEVFIGSFKEKKKIESFLKDKYPSIKFNFHLIRKFPLDERHHYKIDYQALIKKISKRK